MAYFAWTDLLNVFILKVVFVTISFYVLYVIEGRQHFTGVVVECLVDGSELASDSFHYFLSNKSAEEST